MTFTIASAITYTWESVGVVWLAAFPFARRAARSQPLRGRAFHLLLVLLGFTLLGSRYLRFGILGQRFLPVGSITASAGLALTIAGCAFAIWARLALGGNWSGMATVKEGHQADRLRSLPFRPSSHLFRPPPRLHRNCGRHRRMAMRRRHTADRRGISAENPLRGAVDDGGISKRLPPLHAPRQGPNPRALLTRPLRMIDLNDNQISAPLRRRERNW